MIYQQRAGASSPRLTQSSTLANHVKIWYDAEGDYLEVRFSDAPGFMRETPQDAVMERVDEEGRLLGFSIMNVSRISRDEPLVAKLAARLSDAA